MISLKASRALSDFFLERWPMMLTGFIRDSPFRLGMRNACHVANMYRICSLLGARSSVNT